MLAQAIGFAGAPGLFDPGSGFGAAGGFGTPGAPNTPDAFSTPAADTYGGYNTFGAGAPAAFNTPNATIRPGALQQHHRSSGATPPPRPYGSTNSPARKPLSRGIIIGFAAVAVVAAVVTTIVIVALRPDSTGNQATPSNPPMTNEFPATSRSANPPSGAPATGKPVDLLTPASIRQAITALEKVSGSEEFNEATFYPRCTTDFDYIKYSYQAEHTAHRERSSR